MSDLTTFARRLMRINERQTQSNTPSAIFGTIGDLPQSIAARPPYRIGLWPCVSEEKPEIAMGLWVLLSHMLEQWRDIQVYRLFVKLEGDAEDFDWTIEQSQFDVDDWPVDPLDENIAIWGTLNQIEEKWELKLFIENDLLTGEDNETDELVFVADHAINFIAQLGTIAEKVTGKIEAERLDETEPRFDISNLPQEDRLKPLFTNLIKWYSQLLASLWGTELEDEDLEDDFETLLKRGEAVKHDLAAWAVSKAVAHTMLPGYSVIGDLFVERIDEVSSAFPDSQLPIPIIAPLVYNMGDVQAAYDLLEAEVKTHPDSIAARLKLTELYATGGRIEESIDRFQEAIDEEVTNRYLYRGYGNVLLAADQYNVPIEEFVLIDVDEIVDDFILWEAIAAYDEALKLTPDDASVLHTQLLQLLYVAADESRIWDRFEKLLKLDTKGEYIRDAIDSMYDVEDIQPGIEAIATRMKAEGERVDLLMNLALLHLSQEDGDEAKGHLEKAKSLTESQDVLAEIERLLLVADDPEFEQEFAELESIIVAGNKISADNMEFLETAVENAPHLIQAHLMLASAYFAWGDRDAALEALLDVQEKLPDNPSVLDMLARILWDSGEKELALQYLNKGLAAYPFHVRLLVRTGRYLFEDGQLAEARAYLGRAEEISPSDPVLQETRAYIAGKMAENPDFGSSSKKN